MKNKIDSIIAIIGEINDLSLVLSRNEITAFKEVTLRLPDISIYIHGFYTTISWLYVQYHEAGDSTIKFLSPLSKSLSVDSEDFVSNHMKVVHSFRTYLQHNLNIESRADLAKRKICNDWIVDTLQLKFDTDIICWPKNNSEWEIILSHLLDDSEKLFNMLLTTLKRISTDETCSDTINLWIARTRNNIQPFEYDKIIDEVATNLGLKDINTIHIRNKYHQMWTKKIAKLYQDHDFEKQATLEIEHTLINSEELPVPISAQEIMDAFKLSPGKTVGELKVFAQKLFVQNHWTKKRIMEELRERLNNK